MHKLRITVLFLCLFLTSQLSAADGLLLKISESSVHQLRNLQIHYGVKVRYRTADFSIIQAAQSAVPELPEPRILDTISPDFDYYLLWLNAEKAVSAIEQYGKVIERFDRLYLVRLHIDDEEILFNIPAQHRAKLPPDMNLTGDIAAAFAPSLAASPQQQTIIREMLGQVDVNRWFSQIQALVENEDLAQPGRFFRSRYSLRVRQAVQLDGKPKPDHACDNAADYIAEQFRSFGLEVEFDPFLHRRSKIGEGVLGEYTMRNVVATLPGTGRNKDRMYLMIGHYDSIATKTPGWEENWRTLPAPGASDNASGIAEMIETARILSQQEFDFTIRFIAFSGEELFLFGSRHYRDLVKQRGDRIAGVLNFDLLGHDEDSILDIHVLGDEGSQWLVNVFGRAAETYNIDVDLQKRNDPSFIFSDHSPFWELGIPAVMVSEESSLDPPEPKDYIHGPEDTLDQITLPLGERAVKLAVATLAELARPISIEVAPDLFWESAAIDISNPTPTKGESVEISASVKNGGTVPLNGIQVRFVAISPNGKIEQIAEKRVNLEVGSSQTVSATFTPMAWGRFTLRAFVNDDALLFESDFNNNRIETPLIVTDRRVAIENVAAYPNPIRFSESGAALKLSYILNRDADVAIVIYTAFGEKIFEGRFNAGENGGKLGRNDAFTWRGRNAIGGKVAGGIYICQITATDTEGGSKTAKTKVAVAN
jgi:hypothetical protein